MLQEESVGLRYIRTRTSNLAGCLSGVVSAATGFSVTYLITDDPRMFVISTIGALLAGIGTKMMTDTHYRQKDAAFEEQNSCRRQTTQLKIGNLRKAQNIYDDATLLDMLNDHIQSRIPDEGYKPGVDTIIDALSEKRKPLATKLISDTLNKINNPRNLHRYEDILDLTTQHYNRWNRYNEIRRRNQLIA
jgi:hypothetical protein